MPKERLSITPPPDLSNKEAVDRFVVELNTTLDQVSSRLPTVNIASVAKLRQAQVDLSSVATRRAGTIPAVIANPVDVAALKDNLEQTVMAGTRTELAAMKQTVDTLALILTQVLDALVD